MSTRTILVLGFAVVLLSLWTVAFAYPPAVGILGSSKSCQSCHIDNGPWIDESKTIVDIIDKETGQSLLQSDGTFLIEVNRFEKRTVLTVIGRPAGDSSSIPYRNGWHYIDPTQIGLSTLSKFAPGWSVDVPLACRLVGDKSGNHLDAHVTSLPMTVRPLDDASEATLELQVMLTMGESVKGDAKKGLISNYLVRTVRLKVTEKK
jgi:hypothetical protein